MMEIQRFLVDVAADGCHGLSGVEPMNDGVGELVPTHHFFGVLFRVNGKRHNLGSDLFEPLSKLLKVSQLLVAEWSPLSSVKKHYTPTPSEVVGDCHLTALNLWAADRCEQLIVLDEAHVSPIFQCGRTLTWLAEYPGKWPCF